MSEIEGVREQIEVLTKDVKDILSLLGELRAQTHTPAGCMLREKVNALEKQQSRWAGGLVVLVSLTSLLTFLLSKIWK